MIVKRIKPGILSFREALAEPACQALVAAAERHGGWTQAEIARYQNDEIVERAVDLDLRDVEVVSLGDVGWTVGDISAPAILAAANEELDVHADRTSKAVVSRYRPGAHIRPHRDTGVFSTSRLFTCVQYLSESYEGGDLEFPQFRLAYRPQAGECVAFFFEYLHGVSPITAGVCYCTIWFGESSSVTLR